MLKSSLLLLAVLTGRAYTVSPSSDPVEKRQSAGLSLVQQLQLAATAVDRLALLQPSELVFDFNEAANPKGSPGVTEGNGGRTVKADRKSFPALIGSSASMTLGFLGPCGFNTPHTHNRAAELNIVVQGNLIASFTAENGAPHIQHNLTQYQLTVFPQGAMHTEWNPGCTPAVFVAAFPSEDPGVQQAAQTFLGFEDDILEAALNADMSLDGMDLATYRPLIPSNVALGIEKCMSMCNLQQRPARMLKKKRWMTV